MCENTPHSSLILSTPDLLLIAIDHSLLLTTHYSKRIDMKIKHYFILTAILLLFSENIFSQKVVVADSDKQIFSKYVDQIAPYQSEPLDVILEHTARFFLSTPYVAATLDKNDEEQLVVNLHGLDCVTFVENVIALSLITQNNNLTMDYFIEKLTEIRYRNNHVSDYVSRLHYTSDWMFENEKKGLLKNISKELMGMKETKLINFMSSHQSAYKQLANDDAMLSKIVQQEKAINSRGGFYYLPKELIATQAKNIPHMAIVGFVTSINGLDTTHVGFAYRHKNEDSENGINGENEKLTFIHASSVKMEVVIDTLSLSGYCLSQKNCKGILVAITM